MQTILPLVYQSDYFDASNFEVKQYKAKSKDEH
jgi:hypothetical protein